MFMCNMGDLEKIQIRLGISTYEVFVYGAKCWNISESKMEHDFGEYIKDGKFPFYVKSAIELILSDNEDFLSNKYDTSLWI